MASICNDEPGRFGVQGGHGRKTLSLSAWLSQCFGPEPTAPVRMQVAAKRYLAATEPGHFDLLSDASTLSLKLQGGPMSAEQVRAFEAEPFFADPLRLRRWDEEGKIVGFQGRRQRISKPSYCVA